VNLEPAQTNRVRRPGNLPTGGGSLELRGSGGAWAGGGPLGLLLGNGLGDGGRDGGTQFFGEGLGFELFARWFTTELFARSAAEGCGQCRAFPGETVGGRSTFLPDKLCSRAEQQYGRGPLDPGTPGCQQP
jgi:hypothetical protein